MYHNNAGQDNHIQCWCKHMSKTHSPKRHTETRITKITILKATEKYDLIKINQGSVPLYMNQTEKSKAMVWRRGVRREKRKITKWKIKFNRGPNPVSIFVCRMCFMDTVRTCCAWLNLLYWVLLFWHWETGRDKGWRSVSLYVSVCPSLSVTRKRQGSRENEG